MAGVYHREKLRK